MRTLAALIILSTVACASRSGPAVAGSSPVNCPYRVLATVSNPRLVNYDVYYLDAARPATIIGEVSPGSTVTFQLPGEGRGRVYVRRPAADIGSENIGSNGRPLPDIRIRIHCEGT